jgi:hypothetical protein
MDRNGFQAWLDRYVEAWKTYDEGTIRSLWSEDATYRYHPQDEPLRGRDAIVANWLENKDDPGTYDAKYGVLAVDGDTFVANGWSRYLDATTKDMTDEYLNVYVCKFNDAGECTDFNEYWIQNRQMRRQKLDEMVKEHGGTPPARNPDGPVVAA